MEKEKAKTSKSKKKKIIIAVVVIAAIAIVFISLLLLQNLTIKTSVYKLSKENLPEEFKGFKIAQISDLHNAEFGKDNSKLLDILKQNRPDIIVFTGDLVDSNHTNINISLSFAKEAVKIAPCYYVPGNHEAWLDKAKYNNLVSQLINIGVVVLDNKIVYLEKEGAKIMLAGLCDPDFTDADKIEQNGVLDKWLGEIVNDDSFTVLLSHRPEAFDIYAAHDIDVVFCGHAHGGQFRLPFIGGLYAPNQGFFPKYDAGVYNKGNTSMVVSRGIGNSVIPIRVNNRPELVIAELC